MIADIRFALRQLRRSPAFTVAAVITLGLGIGACAAAYSLARGLLWRPLPFDDTGLVVLRTTNPSRGIEDQGLSQADLRDLREQTTSIRGLAAASWRQAVVSTPEGAERIIGWQVDPAFFTTLGVLPALGRTFRPDEADAGAAPVAVLSYRYWTRRFARDPAVIGTTLEVNGTSRTIVGVMPATLSIVRNDVWLPLVPIPGESRAERYFDVVGRLAPGVTLTSATAEMRAAAARLDAAYPVTNHGWTVDVTPYRDREVNPGTRKGLTMMLGAVGVVLLIACANVTGLLLARGAGRARELAVRAAVGASRARIVRQLLAECAVLSVLGGALGVGLATWGNDLLLATLPAEDVPMWLDASLDGVSLAVTAAVTLGAVFLIGLLPAIRASRPAMVDALKGSTAAPTGTRARSALVIGQVGLAVVLLAAAALFSQSFIARQRGTFGFDDRPVITARVFFGAVARPERAAWMRDALARVRTLPGVRAAALTGAIPGDDGGDHRALVVEGRAVAPGMEPLVAVVPASDGFLDAVGLSPLQGRWFTPAEAEHRESAVAAVGASLARRFWPNGDAVGRRIQALPDTTWLTIVGVVPDLQWEELGEDRGPDHLQVHVPYAAEPWMFTALMVRTSGSPGALAEPLRNAARTVRSDVPIFDIRTMSAVRRETSAGDRVWLLIFGSLGLQALVMTAVGLYGLLAYGVSQRRREIGVRMALGARPGSVVRLVVRQALVLTAVGLVLGLGGAVAVSRLLEHELFGVHGTLTPLAAVFVTLLATASVAAFAPARRASRVDPATVLRTD